MRTRQIEAAGKSWTAGYPLLEVIDNEIEQASEYTRPISRLLYGTYSFIADGYWWAAQTAADDGAARIALSLTVYHHEHGKYPTSLTELTRAGWKLPQDPFTQQPYRYRREGQGFIVWSVGPDGADNSATEYDPKKFDPPQPGYDFVFRVTR